MIMDGQLWCRLARVTIDPIGAGITTYGAGWHGVALDPVGTGEVVRGERSSNRIVVYWYIGYWVAFDPV